MCDLALLALVYNRWQCPFLYAMVTRREEQRRSCARYVGIGITATSVEAVALPKAWYGAIRAVGLGSAGGIYGRGWAENTGNIIRT